MHTLSSKSTSQLTQRLTELEEEYHLIEGQANNRYRHITSRPFSSGSWRTLQGLTITSLQ